MNVQGTKTRSLFPEASPEGSDPAASQRATIARGRKAPADRKVSRSKTEDWRGNDMGGLERRRYGRAGAMFSATGLPIAQRSPRVISSM